MAFLTQNPETLSLRWKAIRPNLYTNPINLIHTNICNSTATSFIIHIPPYKYVPLNLITDHDSSILPPSELRSRLPLADWTRISPLTLQFATSGLRSKLNSSLLHGNFAPFYPTRNATHQH